MGQAADDMSDVDDAIVEDTVHCSCCGASFALGNSELYAIIDPPNGPYDPSCEQIKLCERCLREAVRQYRESLDEAGVVLDVLPSGTAGIVDETGVLKIRLISGTVILRGADDWVTA